MKSVFFPMFFDRTLSTDQDEGIPLVEEELLPLTHHTEEVVVQEDDLHVEILLHDRT